ncbi:MAG TPA: LytTR family DNA-binding domain-containing protein [Gemmatimonadaceae bacterium]|nr:LytTR family DNA-binding domain-containing protein [Gemmatimonadaceae bacterium]
MKPAPAAAGVSPMRVLIVDDEALARRRMRSLLAAVPNVAVLGECETGAEAVTAIRDLHPDLVFLDVQMPELDGFDVIAAVGPEKMPPVIFVTAFDDYAVNAFDVGAIDYLLKPVDQFRFNQTLERAKKRVVGRRSQAELAARLTGLLDRVARADVSDDRIGVKVQGKIVFLDADEIYWIQARDDIARVHLVDSAYDVREPLTHLEARLPANRFLRVHRSAIVNTSKVRAAEPFDQGDQLLILRNGKRITTGRSYRKAVKEFLRRAT